jgi:phage terminase large subunit-like protein
MRALWGKHYLPEDVALDSENPNHRLYMVWKEQGWLTLTPGNVTDYEFIKSDAKKLMERFTFAEVAFDRWNSSQLVTDLMNDGANMVAFGQGFASMSPAMKEFERLIKGKQLVHPNDPVMTWAMSNLVATKDPAGNIKPDKAKSANKIDPAVAQIMAAGRAALATIEPIIKTAFVGL